MFKHQGERRTFKHNLQIATILSFVAGLVNVTGFLSFNELTTNVTGHFALFINDVANFEFWRGTIYFLYIFFFLLGSFSSSFLIDSFAERKKRNVFVLLILIEGLILIAIALFSNFVELQYPDVIACSLLFAMGLQNSLVTKISDAVVRTTHLTGLFTDLGIDLSHLFFPKLHGQREKLKETIKLRIYIIAFFFGGGLVGGFFYSRVDLKLNTLLFGAAVLFSSLFYNRVRLVKTKRRYIERERPISHF